MITPAEWDNFSDVAWRTSSYSGNGAACVEVGWRKSSYSGNGGNCVDVGWRREAEALVRDSKAPSGGALRVAMPAWRAFLTALDRRCARYRMSSVDGNGLSAAAEHFHSIAREYTAVY